MESKSDEWGPQEGVRIMSQENGGKGEKTC